MPETPDDHSMDIGVVRYSPGELQPKTLKAKQEDEQRTSEKLMPSFTDEEIAEVSYRTFVPLFLGFVQNLNFLECTLN